MRAAAIPRRPPFNNQLLRPPAVIDDLLRQHRPRVRTLAWIAMQRMPPRIEFDDLFQAGMIGLWQALLSDDEAKRGDGTFVTYSNRRIVGAMLDFLRGQDTLSRDERKKVSRVRAVREQLLSRNGVSPTLGVIAAELRMSVDEVADILRTEEVSSTHTLEPDENVEDMLIGYDCPATVAEQRQWLSRVQARIDALPPNYKLAVETILDGKRPKEAAITLGISDSRASQLLKEVVAYLERDDDGPLWVRKPKVKAIEPSTNEVAQEPGEQAESDDPFVPNITQSTSMDALYAEFGDCLKTRSPLIG